MKTSWRHVLKVSWKHVLKTSLRHVLKTSSRRLQDQQMFAGLCFIVFILSLCLNTSTLESIFEYIRQKWKQKQKTKKKHTYFKISSRDEVLTRLFFLPGWNFISVFLTGMSSSRDEILSRQKHVNGKRHFTIDRDNFILGWNLTRKHPLRVLVK